MICTDKIGLGGSCHWCTEAIFVSLVGVDKVEQGWIAMAGSPTGFSEAVIVHYDPRLISLEVLIEIHVYTHSSRSEHAMREKYRSAIYYFEEDDRISALQIMESLQKQFESSLITQVVSAGEFKLNEEKYLDYYRKDPSKPFCVNYIEPKLQFLMGKYGRYMNLRSS
jgi:peptide-methionine (S)-S-oxide reductase